MKQLFSDSIGANARISDLWRKVRGGLAVVTPKGDAHTMTTSVRSMVARGMMALLLVMGAGHAWAVSSCGGGATTTVTSAEDRCSMGAGETLVINAGGSITAPGSGEAIPLVGSPAFSITNNGNVYGGWNAINIGANNTLSAGLFNTGTISNSNPGNAMESRCTRFQQF